jgi:hypothetical protein
MNKCKIQVLEKWAICWDVFVIHAMAEGTDLITREGSLPPLFDTVDLERGKPLKCVIPLLPLLVHVCSSRGSTRCFPGSRLLVIRTKQLELVMIAYVCNNRIQGCGLKTLVPRAELLKEVLVAGMQRPKKKHHQKNRWDGNLAPCHIVHHPVEAQTKGHNLLGVGHTVIEQ